MTTMFVSLKSKRTRPGYNSCSEMGYLLGRFSSHFESPVETGIELEKRHREKTGTDVESVRFTVD